MNYNEVILTPQNGCIHVTIGTKSLGEIHISHHPYHSKTAHLTLALNSYTQHYSHAIFTELRKITNLPLQIALSSIENEIIDFLLAGCFVCKRKCFEVEASASDYIGSNASIPLSFVNRCDDLYETCCRMMFDRYIETHNAISPWTGTFENFCEHLPKSVICSNVNSEIKAFAFIEENEIAYLCGTDKESFPIFGQAVISHLLCKYDSVCFEADDCDEYAMICKSLFINQPDDSFDTYLMEI